jgi:hypothetical protein
MLPTFVGRLSARLRDRSLEYFNDVARMYKHDGPFRQALPADQRALVDSHLSLHREVNQLAPQLDRLEAFGIGRTAPGQLTEALRVLEHDSSNQSVRMLHVAADLHWVAPSGLLLPYWRTFIRKLLGGYTKTILPAPTDLFAMSAQHEDGHGALSGIEGSKGGASGRLHTDDDSDGSDAADAPPVDAFEEGLKRLQATFDAFEAKMAW